MGSQWRMNSNTFGIDANDKIYVLEIDTGIFPASHPNYLIYNIGRTEVYAKLKYGTKVMWHGVADEATIPPGEKKILDNGGRPYYVTGLKVYNKTDTRAVVHCATEDDKYPIIAKREPGSFDEVRNKLLKAIIVAGIKFVPYVGSGLSGLVGAFWPDGKPSAWEQVKDKLNALLDQSILQAISGILSGRVNAFKDRITAVSNEIDNGTDPEYIREHFMNIAQDLIGAEKEFIFSKDIPSYQSVNQYVLPLYSTFVLMKISFYVIGIQKGADIGLTEEDVTALTSYGQRTLQDDGGANKYITDLYQERVDHSYKKTFAEDLYDNMMNVRSFIATQGLEYIPIWNHMLEDPENAVVDVYNDVISYSTFFGRQTPNLINEAIPTQLSEPLTPSLIDGKRNKVVSVDLYIWRINNGEGPPRIGGMKVAYENGESYTMGTESGEVETVEFNGALLTKLEVYGGGAIDLLTFSFNDDRSITVGESSNKENTVFELENHHIVSFFLSSDNFSLGGQAANICVAYQLINEATP